MTNAVNSLAIHNSRFITIVPSARKVLMNGAQTSAPRASARLPRRYLNIRNVPIEYRVIQPSA
jgi:hypothetical protein